MPKTTQEYLKKVCESKEFEKSHTHKILLTYLVEQTLADLPPKEISIAIEVFNQSGGEWNSGSKVRVYVYNLRKRLDSYYRNEGQDDLVKFFIPKGSYKVDFIKETPIAHSWHRFQTPIWQITAAVFFTLSLYLIISKDNTSISSNDLTKSALWSSFVRSSDITKIVLGDYYVMKNQVDDEDILFTRDVEINSDKDFDNMQRKIPMEDRVYKKSKHSFLGKFAPYTIQQISPITSTFQMESELLLSSQFRWSDMKNANLIYIGSFKSLKDMTVFLNGANFEYTIMPNRLTFTETSSDSTYQLSSHDSNIENAYETDYAVVTKMRTADNHSVLMIMASRDIGLMASVNLLSDSELLSHFEKESDISKPETCFEACFRIEGLNRNVIDIELQFLNIIDRPFVMEFTPDHN